MENMFQAGTPSAQANCVDPGAGECIVASPVFTDDAGRALVIYQRLIESGFDTAQVMTGT